MIEVFAPYNVPPFLKGRGRDMRVLWALEELGLPYEIRWLDMGNGEHKAPAFRAVNPFGKIPAIKDGGKALFESGAILLHLAEKAGKLGGAKGTDEPGLVRQWCFAAVNTVETPFLELFACDTFWKDQPNIQERRATAFENVKTKLSELEPVLAANDYVAGGFSVADVLLGHVLTAPMEDSAFAGAPKSSAYVTGLKRRPAYERAFALHLTGPK